MSLPWRVIVWIKWVNIWWHLEQYLALCDVYHYCQIHLDVCVGREEWIWTIHFRSLLFQRYSKYCPLTINFHVTRKPVRNTHSWALNQNLLESFCVLRFQQLKFENQCLYYLCFYLLSFKITLDAYYYLRIGRVKFIWSVSMWKISVKMFL